jgi:hypothetical protein
MANPKFVTLSVDVEQTITLDSNYSQVEVALISGAATTYFNTTDTTIGSVSGTMDGNHALTTTLVAKVVQDGTGGAASKVHLRSAGTPTVQVLGI